jgi:3-deoxy-D-manno-octulosonate 8-phosphate phosphatase KdsC-like HAD superfamily phosphatase
MSKSYKEYLHQITTFVFDVDGVLTDGTITITTDGEMHRTMHTKDGFALKEALLRALMCVSFLAVLMKEFVNALLD